MRMGNRGSGWEASRQKGQSHARDGELSAWLIKILAPLPFPVLGRRLQNRLKSDVLVSCNALSRVRSISINYLLELFSLGGPLEQPATLGLTLWSLLMQLRGAGARLAAGSSLCSLTLILSRSLHARLLPHPLSRAESWDGISANRQWLSDPPSHKQRVLAKIRRND